MEMGEQNTTIKKKTFCNCYCCVSNCSSKKDRNKNLHFHSFPKEGLSTVYMTNDSGVVEKIDRRKAWTQILKIQKPVSHHMRVCSLHFKDSDYLITQAVGLKNMKAPRLKFNSVPSQNLPTNQNEKRKTPFPQRKQRNEVKPGISDLTENEQSVVHALMDLKSEKYEKQVKSSKDTRNSKVRNYNCCVVNCSSSKDENETLCFHKFPKEGASTVSVTNASGKLEKIDRRKAWIERLLLEIPVTNNMWVCSLHFQESDYLNKDTAIQKMETRRLKQTAIPSRNLPKEQYMRFLKLEPESNNANSDPESNKVRLEPEPNEVKVRPEVSDLTENEHTVVNALLDLKSENSKESGKAPRSTQKKNVHNCNCCVINCHSRRGNNKDLHFHRFPREGLNKVYVTNASGIVEKIDRRTVWIQKLLMRKPITRHLSVCSRHFQDSDYLSSAPALQVMTSPKLKCTAVPSQNLPTEEDIRKKMASYPRLKYQDPNFEEKLLEWFENSGNTLRDKKKIKKLYLTL